MMYLIEYCLLLMEEIEYHDQLVAVSQKNWLLKKEESGFNTRKS